MNLNLKDLKDNKIDIIKAEIGALLFNLRKFSAKFIEKQGNNNRNSFVNSLDYTSSNLVAGFIKNNSFVIANENFELEKIVQGKNKQKFPHNIFWRGCESINSGIDKNTVQDENKQDSYRTYIANAFGREKKPLDLKKIDYQLDTFIEGFEKLLNQIPYQDWNKLSEYALVNFRGNLIELVKKHYRDIPGETRRSANDVTLWDQAYMTATLFKATVVTILLERERLNCYQDDPQCIRWRILGIQHDKLGLAEKGLESTYINWYRDKARKVDDSVKKLLETEYPLGNEIYRDETGIYFLVPENIKGKQSGDFYLLSNDLEDIQENILKIFTQNFEGEVYPAIFLTEASRGTMNIAHLIERAKENFLKATYPNDLEECLKYDDSANGICQVCGMRLAKRKDDEENNLICDVCREKKESRIDNWLKSINGETIWTGDLQDENGRIAPITLKFELAEWLNGNLSSSTLVQRLTEDYSDSLEKFENLLQTIKETFSSDLGKYTNFYGNNKNNKEVIDYFLSFFDEKGIREPFNKIYNNIVSQYPQKSTITNETVLNNIDLFDRIFFEGLNRLGKTSEENRKGKIIYDVSRKYLDLDKWGAKFQNQGKKDLVKEVFAFFFVVHQIKAILLERSIGDTWKTFLKNKLEDKINFDDRKIKWSDLNESDIDFLAHLLLQFLLRKNPSPARMRRIWETTQDFFYDIRQHIQASTEIPEWRCKRLIWNKVFEGKGERSREYEYSGLDFWVDKKGSVYLISSLTAAIDTLSGNQNKLDRKKIKEQINEERGDWLKKEIALREYGKTNDKTIDLNLKDAKYENFLPYFSILDPTPISYQFIIPADRVPTLIKKVQEAYEKEFKWVIGKLPLHIGVVIQNYKKPLYVGIKALRNIRHDIDDWDQIRTRIDAKSLKAMQKEAFSCHTKQENLDKLESFYSFYEKEQGEGSYKFYLRPQDKPVWLNTTETAADNDIFIIYPNTVDFEFMDVNTRRNDIHYNKKGRRVKEEKRNRPYTWGEWQIFYDFGNYFEKTKLTGKLQNIVSLIYSKLNDWKDNDDAIKSFLLSAFINVLDLKGKNEQLQKLDEFAKLLGQSDWNSVEDLNPGVFKETLWQFIDMFEFWHIHLKKI